MLLYTHVVTALKVKSLLSLDIDDTSVYLLGAILPDVRYLAGIPRERTHLDIQSLLHLARENDISDKDLLTGYIVHLIADSLNESYIRKLLFPRLSRAPKRIILTGLFSIILEIYYQTLRVNVPMLSDNAGKIGQVLSLSPESVSELVKRTDTYLKDPSLEQAIKSITGSSVETNKNVQFYINIGKFIHRTPPVRNYIIRRVSDIREKLEYVLASRCVVHLEKLQYLDKFNL